MQISSGGYIDKDIDVRWCTIIGQWLCVSQVLNSFRFICWLNKIYSIAKWYTLPIYHSANSPFHLLTKCPGQSHCPSLSKLFCPWLVLQICSMDELDFVQCSITISYWIFNFIILIQGLSGFGLGFPCFCPSHTSCY